MFGAVFGSFLNVCILRWGAEPKQSVMHPPSRCPGCGHQIRWYENIPIVSWLVLRGRCSRVRQAHLAALPRDRARHGAALGGRGGAAGADAPGLRAGGRLHDPASASRSATPEPTSSRTSSRSAGRRSRWPSPRTPSRRRAGRDLRRALRRGPDPAGRGADRAGAGPGGDGRRRLRAHGHGRRVLRLGVGLAGARARRLHRPRAPCVAVGLRRHATPTAEADR